MSKQPGRAALYVRVSTDEQAEHGHSIDAQLRLLRELCERRGWLVVGEYVDAGESGKTMVRPQMRRLLRDARSDPRTFDVIAVHKLDRFSRNILDTVRTLAELREFGIGFVSATEDFDFTTPVGKVLLTLLAAFAEIYIDNLSAETKKGKAERARKGLYNGSLPFGYMRRMATPLSDADKVPMIDPERIEGYRLAIRLCAEGKTPARIKDVLNAAGYRTSGNWGARPFGKDTLLPMLKSRFYLGQIRLAEQWVPGLHEPAIDAETWQRAQEQIAGRSRGKFGTKHNDHVYVLRGLIVCAECGHRLRSFSLAGGRRFYRDTAGDRGYTCSQRRSIVADTLEQSVGDWLGRVVLPADWQEQALELIGEDAGDGARREAQRRSLEGQLERTRKLYLLGDLNEREFLAEREQLAAEIAGLQPVKRLNLQQAAAFLADIKLIWEAATREERGEVARALLKRIYVRDGEIVAIEPRPEYHPLLTVALGPNAGAGSPEEGCEEGTRRPSLPLVAKPLLILPPGARYLTRLGG